LLLLGTGLVACGAGKRETAKDPSEANTNEPPKDEVPKWEGATNPTPEDPKPKAGAKVNEAPTKRSDQYDKEATEVVLKRAARQVQANCGAAKDETGKSGPWGKATIQVQLGHNGHSKGVTVPAPYQGKASGNCVEKAFTNLTFPPWSGQDAQIDWEVEIVEPGKEPKK
jgi:hypothetical protein